MSIRRQALGPIVISLVISGCDGNAEVTATGDATIDVVDVMLDSFAPVADSTVADTADAPPPDTTTEAAMDATDTLLDGGDCTPVGGTCPSSCPAATTGQRYDAGGDCFEPGEVFGCLHGVDSPGVARCRKLLSTGALYRFDLMEPPADDPAWGTCTDAEAAKVTRYPPNGCTSDGGADTCADFDAGDECCCNGTDLTATPICVDGGLACPAGYSAHHGDDCFRLDGPCSYTFGVETGGGG